MQQKLGFRTTGPILSTFDLAQELCRIFDQGRLSRVCAMCADSTELRCSHTQRMNVDENSNQILDHYPRWLRQNEHLKKTCAYAISTLISWLGSFI